MNALFFYLGLSLATEVINLIVAENGYSTELVFDLFILSQSLLLGLIYYYRTRIKKWANKLVLALSCITVALFIVNFFFTIRNTYYASAYLFIIVFSLINMYGQLEEPDQKGLASEPFFWINTAVLFYFSTSFFLFLFDDFISASGKQIAQLLWSIHLLVNFGFYMLLSVGIWKTKQA